MLVHSLSLIGKFINMLTFMLGRVHQSLVSDVPEHSVKEM